MDRLCNARNVIISMCHYRKYNVSQTELNYAEFVNQYPNALTNASILNFAASKGSSQIMVHFTYEEKISKQAMENIINNYMGQGLDTVILVTLSKLNTACKTLISNTKLNFEHFLISEVQANISKHKLVIPHRIMSEEEKEAVMKKYKMSSENIPAILTTDMMCRFVGGKVGDMVELIRNSETAGRSIYYRIVKKP